MTGILVNGLLAQVHGNSAGKWPREGHRIVHRELVDERSRVHTREALDQTQVLRRSTLETARVDPAAEACRLVGEVGGLYHQRVPLPVAP